MRKRWIVDLGTWSVGLALFALIMWRLGPAKIVRSLEGASLDLLIWSICVTVLASLLRLSKWYWALHREHGLIDIATMFFSSKAFGALLPARVGEFAPVLWCKNRTARVSALIITDRLLEVSATLCIGAWGILSLGFHSQDIILAGTTVSVMIPLLFAGLSSKALWQRVEQCAPRKGIIARCIRLMIQLSESLRQLFRLLLPLMILTIVAAGLGLFQFRLFLQTVGADAGFPLAAAIIGVAAVASFVAFTPWGLGIVDAPLLYLASTQDVSPAAAGGFLILARAVPIGLDWFLYGVTWLLAKIRRTS